MYDAVSVPHWVWVLAWFCSVLVSAVYKKMAPPQLHFFNNCFGDQFSTREQSVLASYLQPLKPVENLLKTELIAT